MSENKLNMIMLLVQKKKKIIRFKNLLKYYFAKNMKCIFSYNWKV